MASKMSTLLTWWSCWHVPSDRGASRESCPLPYREGGEHRRAQKREVALEHGLETSWNAETEELEREGQSAKWVVGLETHFRGAWSEPKRKAGRACHVGTQIRQPDCREDVPSTEDKSGSLEASWKVETEELEREGQLC